MEYIYIFYLIFIVYVLITSEKIALLEALSGRSIDEIAFAREMLFKNRLGWEKSLIYVNAIFTSALIPFVIAAAYATGSKLRHFMLLLFCLSLMPSLEKALILKALLPVMMLGLNGYFTTARAFNFGAAMLIVIALAVVVSKAGSVDYFTSNEIRLRIIESEIRQVKKNIRDNEQLRSDVANSAENILLKKVESEIQLVEKNIRDNDALKIPASSSRRKEVPEIYLKQLKQLNAERQMYTYVVSGEKMRNDGLLFAKQLAQLTREYDYHVVALKHLHKYNVFGSGQLQFVANRIFWIPYVTAYDWISYFDEALNMRYLHGASSSLGAWITGVEKFPVELEVFKYQFGGGGPQSAAANANFWIDAFVNFGWLGVVLYSFIFAGITFLLIYSKNPAALACYYFFVIQASLGGMVGVLFSNGLLLLLALAYLFPLSKDKITPK